MLLVGPVLDFFAIPPNSKIGKSVKKLFALRQLAQQICCGFKATLLKNMTNKGTYHRERNKAIHSLRIPDESHVQV